MGETYTTNKRFLDAPDTKECQKYPDALIWKRSGMASRQMVEKVFLLPTKCIIKDQNPKQKVIISAKIKSHVAKKKDIFKGLVSITQTVRWEKKAYLVSPRLTKMGEGGPMQMQEMANDPTSPRRQCKMRTSESNKCATNGAQTW